MSSSIDGVGTANGIPTDPTWPPAPQIPCDPTQKKKKKTILDVFGFIRIGFGRFDVENLLHKSLCLSPPKLYPEFLIRLKKVRLERQIRDFLQDRI